MPTEIIEAPTTTDDPAFKDMMKNIVGKKQEPEPEKPKMWAILLHNDDTTFPQFVVRVLSEAFKVEGQAASRIMLKAHRTGQDVVTVTTKDQADTMIDLAEVLIRGAQPQVDFLSHGGLASCELKFSLREETPDKG